MKKWRKTRIYKPMARCNHTPSITPSNRYFLHFKRFFSIFLHCLQCGDYCNGRKNEKKKPKIRKKRKKPPGLIPAGALLDEARLQSASMEIFSGKFTQDYGR